MTLDHSQRVALYALYRLLQKAEPHGNWEDPMRVILEGFEGEYDQLEPAFYKPVSPAECELVKKLLHMFESLRDSYQARQLSDPELSNAVTFTGFDRSKDEEGRLARYAEYLFDKGRWGSLKPHIPDLNSHMPMLTEYRRMLDAFSSVIDHEFARDFREKPLSEQELKVVVGAVP